MGILFEISVRDRDKVDELRLTVEEKDGKVIYKFNRYVYLRIIVKPVVAAVPTSEPGLSYHYETDKSWGMWLHLVYMKAINELFGNEKLASLLDELIKIFEKVHQLYFGKTPAEQLYSHEKRIGRHVREEA